MSGQPTVLQVVIMRDGLLVGTEVFVPGQYTLGSGDGVDLHLDDPGVGASHAFLYFQNGRAAIQDGGSGATFVNGHKVTACEVRPVDEIACGPFTLKIRVMGQKPSTKQAPPANVAAMLGGPPAPAPQAPRAAPAPQTPRPAAVAAPAARPQPPATVVSNRRMNAAPQPAEPVAARASHLRPVPVEDLEARTESVSLGADELLMPTNPRNVSVETGEEMLTIPLPATATPRRRCRRARTLPRRLLRRHARRCPQPKHGGPAAHSTRQGRPAGPLLAGGAVGVRRQGQAQPLRRALLGRHAQVLELVQDHRREEEADRPRRRSTRRCRSTASPSRARLRLRRAEGRPLPGLRAPGRRGRAPRPGRQVLPGAARDARAVARSAPLHHPGHRPRGALLVAAAT